jgi:hypothetical protein
VVLLDAGGFVVDVQGRNNSIGDDPGAKWPRRSFDDPAIKDQLNLLGASNVQVLPNYFFKEDPPADRTVQHLGQRKLDLQDRELIAVSRLPISGREGMWQQAQPFA